MTNIKPMKLKQWLFFSSLVFSVGFGINFATNRNARTAVINGGIGVTAANLAALTLDWRQRKSIIANLSSTQVEREEVEKQLQNLPEPSIGETSRLSQLQQELTEARKILRGIKQQHQHFETRLKQLKYQKSKLDQAISEKEDQAKSLQLNNEQLEQREQQLNEVLESLTEQTQNQRQEIAEQSTQQEAQIRSLQESIEALTHRQGDLTVQEAELENSIRDLQASKEQLLIEVADVKDYLKELNRLYNHQAQKISSQSEAIRRSDEEEDSVDKGDSLLIRSTETPTKELSSNESSSEELFPKASSIPIVKSSNGESSVSAEKATEPDFEQPITHSHRSDFSLKNTLQSKAFWENEILPKWQHSDRPLGQRFLGSVKIEQDISNYLLEVVGDNLRRLDTLTYERIYQEFGEPEKSWLKLLTLALSEYAYYYSADRFWEGFCERLDLPISQSVENTLRKIVSDGVNALGLVKTQSGYTYVSTLWLQSGIPKQNLDHFAQLVHEVSDAYGWWELAHTDDQELSQALMDFSQNKHAAWGTLNNFLKVSCSDQNDIALSGQLVKGIAMVAQQLEQQGQTSQALLDAEQREHLLSQYYLPSSFFLRDWSTVAQVLTPKSSETQQSNRRKQRSLFLRLEIETLNTELVLPEQRLWQREWQDLRGTFCQITEAEWEDVIPEEGDLEIPTLSAVVNEPASEWEWHLQNHLRNRILSWQLTGIDHGFPCLFFDAITGEHISLSLTSPVLAGRASIVCYLPKDWRLDLNEGIEILDSYLPSSIRTWRGQELEIAAERAFLKVSAPNDGPTTEIIWQRSEGRAPILQGLKLRGPKPIYLGKPILQYPPHVQNETVNLLVESTSQKRIVARQLESILASDRWATIKLDDSIATADTYEMKIWTERQEWPSYKFEVRSLYQLTEPPQQSPITIVHSVEVESEGEDSRVQTSDRFWADDIEISGLWPLETVTFKLMSHQSESSHTAQADSAGKLTFKTTSFYGYIPDAAQYKLAYERLGFPAETLLSFGHPETEPNWELTANSIILSHPGADSTLTYWNLLLPELPDQEIAIAAVEQIEIALPRSSGIYFLQLKTPQKSIPLGWWCGSNQYALPEELEDEALQNSGALENYCYALLDNEPLDSFAEAINQLSLDLSLSKLESGFEALQRLPVHFPDWLDKHLLIDKINLLIEKGRRGSLKRIKSNDEPAHPQGTPENLHQPSDRIVDEQLRLGSWYWVTVWPRRQTLFLTLLKDLRQQKTAASAQILSVRKCRVDYPNSVLIQVDDADGLADINQMLHQVKGFQRIEQQTLSIKDVERMMEDDA